MYICDTNNKREMGFINCRFLKMHTTVFIQDIKNKTLKYVMNSEVVKPVMLSG